MPQIRIYIDGDLEQPTPTPTPTPEPATDLQAEIDRINRALCDVLTRIAKIEGDVRGLRLRLIEDDAEGQVP
jgi:predicted  nucleic acid-binding Zn-ribbon protein